MHLEALLARERARTSRFQFHRSDEVIDARFTTGDPAISKRLMRLGDEWLITPEVNQFDLADHLPLCLGELLDCGFGNRLSWRRRRQRMRRELLMRSEAQPKEA